MEITLQLEAVGLKTSLKLYLDTTRQQLAGLQHINALLQMCISEVEFDPDQQPAWRELQKRTEILKVMRNRIRLGGRRWAPVLSPIPSPEAPTAQPCRTSAAELRRRQEEEAQAEEPLEPFQLSAFTWMDTDKMAAPEDMAAQDTADTDEGSGGDDHSPCSPSLLSPQACGDENSHRHPHLDFEFSLRGAVAPAGLLSRCGARTACAEDAPRQARSAKFPDAHNGLDTRTEEKLL
ncbi:hypothetical protein AK812_SmicGene4178 [Symbiodinium microadriaticum]|uniref:Uncharacterized protein n=1 Tax=Symbiodinium microadriaticum TaxID=2951 RepID=A0A1Q9EWV1_SYMMI|nr:hypothetical protein AK812_SmicGene4178 [Symbiodinium microadriaticum]